MEVVVVIVVIRNENENHKNTKDLGCEQIDEHNVEGTEVHVQNKDSNKNFLE